MIGAHMPDIALPSTDGRMINLARLDGRSVAFFYPYTGQPGVPDPPGWDDIPGAHGSTPQARAFSERSLHFETLGVQIFGVSFQDRYWQREFVERNQLSVPLLSDENHALSSALNLETFRAGAEFYLVRTTFIINAGTIEHIRKPVDRPQDDASACLAILKQ
jgi:peroxiredoxin